MLACARMVLSCIRFIVHTIFHVYDPRLRPNRVIMCTIYRSHNPSYIRPLLAPKWSHCVRSTVHTTHYAYDPCLRPNGLIVCMIHRPHDLSCIPVLLAPKRSHPVYDPSCTMYMYRLISDWDNSVDGLAMTDPVVWLDFTDSFFLFFIIFLASLKTA